MNSFSKDIFNNLSAKFLPKIIEILLIIVSSFFIVDIIPLFSPLTSE